MINSDNSENKQLDPDPSSRGIQALFNLTESIDRKDSHIIHLQKRTNFQFIVVLLVVLVLIGFFGYREVFHGKTLARTIQDFTWSQDNFELKDLGPVERRQKFRKKILAIIACHGKTYRKENVQAMTKQQKNRYIDLCYEAAEDFKFGYFDIPAHHKKESSFNPLQEGPCGEYGLGQLMFYTAMAAQGYLKTLPKWLYNKYKFEIKKPEDLYDPILNTKATFVLKYCLKNNLKGMDIWTTSIYKWGGFLWRYFQKGSGQLFIL